jgi:hypothetical protein
VTTADPISRFDRTPPSELTPAERAAAVAALLDAGLPGTSTPSTSRHLPPARILRKSRANRLDGWRPASVTVHAG